MPAMVAWIVNGLMIVFRSRIGQLILGALAWLGLTYGTQKLLVQPMIDALYSHVTELNTTGGDIGAFMLTGLGIMKVDVAFTMCISAITMRAGMVAARVRWLRKP